MIYIIAIRKPDGSAVYYRQHAIGYLRAVGDIKDATHYDSQQEAADVRIDLINRHDDNRVTKHNTLVGIDRAAIRQQWQGQRKDD